MKRRKNAMATQLNQIVAVEKGLKGRTMAAVNEIDKTLDKPALYNGLSRVYTPKNDEGDVFPPERTSPRLDMEQELAKLAALLTPLVDVTLTKDVANNFASSSVVVDGQTLVEDAPVPFLLFLVKQLVDMRTRISRLPVRDDTERWIVTPDSKTARTEPTQTVKTTKVPKVLTLAPATDKHAAQTHLYNEDVVTGTWETTKYSGAISQVRKDELLARVDKLSDAIKVAVEAANQYEITQKQVGANLFAWLLATG
jgi:hypothetical protein